MELIETFKQAKAASRSLALIPEDLRNQILQAVADAIVDFKERILAANEKDLAKMDPKNPLYDRLQLTDKRLDDIASDMRHVAELPSPLGHVTKQKTLPNGLRLHRVSVPFGVIGMIYEARPNVTFDVFSLCFKSGNACVLKGGSDADLSNQASVELIHEVLKQLYRPVHSSWWSSLDRFRAKYSSYSCHRDGCWCGEHLLRCGWRHGERQGYHLQRQDTSCQRLQCPRLLDYPREALG